MHRPVISNWLCLNFGWDRSLIDLVLKFTDRETLTRRRCRETLHLQEVHGDKRVTGVDDKFAVQLSRLSGRWSPSWQQKTVQWLLNSNGDRQTVPRKHYRSVDEWTNDWVPLSTRKTISSSMPTWQSSSRIKCILPRNMCRWDKYNRIGLHQRRRIADNAIQLYSKVIGAPDP